MFICYVWKLLVSQTQHEADPVSLKLWLRFHESWAPQLSVLSESNAYLQSAVQLISKKCEVVVLRDMGVV
jgi:hypothetical protein